MTKSNTTPEEIKCIKCGMSLAQIIKGVKSLSACPRNNHEFPPIKEYHSDGCPVLDTEGDGHNYSPGCERGNATPEEQLHYNKDYEYALAHPDKGVRCQNCKSTTYHPVLGCPTCGKYKGYSYKLVPKPVPPPSCTCKQDTLDGHPLKPYTCNICTPPSHTSDWVDRFNRKFGTFQFGAHGNQYYWESSDIAIFFAKEIEAIENEAEARGLSRGRAEKVDEVKDEMFKRGLVLELTSLKI